MVRGNAVTLKSVSSQSSPSPGGRAPERPEVDAEALCAALLPDDPNNRVLRELCRILDRLDPTAAVDAQLETLDQLGDWLGARGKLPRVEGLGAGQSGCSARLELLAIVLEHAESWRVRAARWLTELLSASHAESFFCTTGLPGQPGFFSEALDRTAQKLLPAPRDLRSLPELLERVFPKELGSRWLLDVPGPLFARLGKLLGEACWAPLRTGMVDAMGVLSTRISAAGLAEDVRARSSGTALRHSPFIWLPRDVSQLVAHPTAAHLAALRVTLQRVADELEAVHAHLEEHGVSVDLVYRLELTSRMAERLGRLAELCFSDVGPYRFGLALQLFTAVSTQSSEARSLRSLWRTNTTLLARKVVERAGHRGEHYITHNRAEYVAMLRAAAGGGVLTAGTAAVKLFVANADLPLGLVGLASAANYAGSFLLLQAFAFALATKQPAMTAPALADALRRKGGAGLTELTTLIAQMIRSQLAVAVGNVALVIPATLGVDLVCRLLTGHPLLDAHVAEHVFESLDVRRWSTIGYGAFTGVLLWSSGLAAGWFENWVVFRRLPEAFAHHRLGKLFGQQRMAALGKALGRGASGIGGNVSLGLLLGGVPVIGQIFGLPLQVRHLTLSAGTLGLAISALGRHALQQPATWMAIAGLGVIGLLNFGVSFGCALLVAVRAQGREPGILTKLAGSVLLRLRHSPREFLLPPAEEPDFEIDVDFAGAGPSSSH